MLNLAEELGNVSKACKMMGLSRDTFYRYKSAVEAGGIGALFGHNRRKRNKIREWDNRQHFLASVLTSTADSSVVIRKLCNAKYKSPTKTALMQYKYNEMKYLVGKELRRAVMISLNRGEAYTRLYRAVTLLRQEELTVIKSVKLT